MRLISLALVAALAPAPAEPPTATPPATSEPADPEDILGDLVVAAKHREAAPLRLPKIGVEALADDADSLLLLAILRNDLDLSFELEVLDPLPPLAPPELPAAPTPEATPAPAAPPAPRKSRTNRKIKAEPPPPAPPEPIVPPPPSPQERWRSAGAEYLVQVRATAQSDGQLELAVILYSLRDGDGPVFKRALVAAPDARRLTTHRLGDAILGAITGYGGPFASQLTFVRTAQGQRQVHVIDGDGDGLTARSPPERLAVSPAFGPDHALYYAASVDRGRYRLYRDGLAAPIDLPIVGSIYGVAFSDDRARVALAIAVAGDIRVFVGPADFSTLEPRTALPLALHPVFTPRGALAYAGVARSLQRIYIDGRAVSASGLSSAAPSFCRHPDGTRVVYSVTVGSREDIVTTDERGGDTVRLTAGKGRNSYPACSPDGRLVAFFSTRSDGAGPGLYLTRVDGRRPAKKISDALGDTLRWARIP